MDPTSKSRAILKGIPLRERRIPKHSTHSRSPKRLFLLSFLILLLLFTPLSGIFSFIVDVHAAVMPDTTGYPYIGQSASQIDQWGFYKTECVSYVAYRINSDRGAPNFSVNPPVDKYFYNTMFGEGAYRFSSGGNWDNAVRSATQREVNPNSIIHVTVDNVPAVGAVAEWESGHVAYVEYVHLNGNIDVSEYNWGSPSHSYGERYNIAPADHYIHFNVLTDNTGGIGGYIKNTDGQVNTRPTVVTLEVTSEGETSKNFYSQKTTNGTYYFPEVPVGRVTLSANDNINNVSIANVYVTANTTRYYNITLNNQCIDGSITASSFGGSSIRLASTITTASIACSVAPYIENMLSGGGDPGGGEPVCTTPPSSTVDVTGATPGNNGWWKSSTQLSLFANAPCGSEDLKTYYKINDGSQQQYSSPFTINQEGIHNVTYYSVDKLGNTEETKSVQVKIDWTPPVSSGTATGPRDTNGIFRDDVTAGVTSTDNVSGVESQQRSIDGGTNWTTMSGSNNTFPIAGNGVSRFVFRAIDVAGNEELMKDSGPIIINKYVIYTSGTADSLRFLSSTGVNIAGDIYSGGTVRITSNTSSVLGTTMKTVGVSNIFNTSNTNVQVPSISTGTPVVPMLSYPLSLYKSMATIVFPSDLYMDSVDSQLNGIMYVEGNVRMTNVALSGPLSIVATGSIEDITTNSTFQSGDPNNGVLLYSGGNIEVKSTGNRNLGLMYAPNGMVKIKATGLTLKGSLVGKEVELYGTTNFNLSYDAAFAPSTHPLPLVSMGLVQNTTTHPPLPGTTTPSKPSNGTSQYVSKVRLTWKSASGAVGYNLQIAKDTNFSNVVFNGSYLSTGASVSTLQKGVKYYWRVRTINAAGMSNWSTVWNFTGK